MSKKSVATQSTANKVAFGENGVRVITNAETSLAGETFAVIEAWTDTSVNADSSANNGDTSISLSFTAGQRMYGTFKNITSTGGILVCYIK